MRSRIGLKLGGVVSMDIPKDFFTVSSMLTLSGATGATFVICNGLQRAFDFNPRWLALAVAEVITLGGVYASGGDSWTDYLVGIVNGFLVYCSAGGATSVIGNNQPGPGIAPRTKDRRTFLTPWF